LINFKTLPPAYKNALLRYGVHQGDQRIKSAISRVTGIATDQFSDNMYEEFSYISDDTDPESLFLDLPELTVRDVKEIVQSFGLMED
jgi:hypothetical protein